MEKALVRRTNPQLPQAVRSGFAHGIEKDYHRIIGSASFRRLQDKTRFSAGPKRFRADPSHPFSGGFLPGKVPGAEHRAENSDGDRDDSFLPEHKAAVCDILQCAGLLHDIEIRPLGILGSGDSGLVQKNLKELEFKGKPLTELLSDQMIRDFTISREIPRRSAW